MALYGIAAFGYLRLHRRRQERFVLAFALSFVLLAEAMVVIAWARNWQVSWWEWHILMFTSFVLIALLARAEWHEERFSALYLDETLAGAREVSVVFADLAGYTSFTEQRASEEVAAMLNEYYGQIIPLMERAGGEVHQIVGDELMVLFGKDDTVSEHASSQPTPRSRSRTSRSAQPRTTRTGPGSASACRAARCTRVWSARRAATASTA